MTTTLALILWFTSALAADAPINQSPYEVSVGRDIALSALVGGVSIIPRLQAEELMEPWCGLDCKRSDVGAIDRWAIGNLSKDAGVVSDITYVSSMALPHVLGFIDVAASNPEDGWGGYGTDTLVILQTLSISLGVSNGLNLLVRRPRPYQYDPNVSDEKRLEAIATLSFPSGHTTAAFSMATASSQLFTLRHPKSPLVVPVWAFTYSMAGTTGYLRIVAGDHFPTDVMVGVATGIGWGLFIPWTHLRNEYKKDPSKPRASIEPMHLEEGAGAIVRIR